MSEPKAKGLVKLKITAKKIDPASKPPTVENVTSDITAAVEPIVAPSLFQRRAVTAKQKAEAIAASKTAELRAVAAATAESAKKPVRTFAKTMRAEKPKSVKEVETAPDSNLMGFFSNVSVPPVAAAPAPAPSAPPVIATPLTAAQDETNDEMFENSNSEDIFESDDEEGILPDVKVTGDTAVDPRLLALQSVIDATMSELPYEEVSPEPYHPQDRKGFLQFITSRYSQFKLPQVFDKRINPKACDIQTLQTYKYQAFVREFMRSATPYRGVLVYHGLGSGKTCTSIAAAEAIYGQEEKRIIVMTPATLKQNYLSELTKCGFRHHNLENFWVAFPIKPIPNQYFAQSVLGIPERYINSLLRKPEHQRVFWMPDLSKPSSESNYKTLQPWQQSAIREQINQVLNAKIEFISYNGITTKTLMKFVEEKTHFDNAVIVIDEVHNITRMMYKKIDSYLAPPTVDRRGMPKPNKMAEYVTTEKWVPSRLGDIKRYKRSFVLYRLLAQAQNSKIIALSGTPIVNYPTEIGILANILRGYFHCVRVSLATTDNAELKSVEAILSSHPRVNYYAIQKAMGTSTLFFSKLDDDYYKVIDKETGGLVGVAQKTEGDDIEIEFPESIQDIFAEVKRLFEMEGIRIVDKPEFMALPLFPPTRDEFTRYFINTNDITIENELTFMKRMSGLVSYYKGSKKELMPEVVKDEVVKVNLSALQLPKYTAARKQELEEEEASAKKKPKFDELEGFEDEQKVMSYRFLSRSICNFVFPTDLERPLPRKKKDISMAIDAKDITIGDGTADLATDAAGVAAAEAEAKAAKVEDDETEAMLEEIEMTDEAQKVANSDALALEKAAAGVKRFASYQEELQHALKELYRRKNTLFRTDESAAPEEQLATYSPKYYAILQKMREAPGSSLVYSAFKTVEGLGTFAMALEANDFAPIRLQGPETNLELAPETVASFLERPEQFRFILYSGDSSAVERATLLNIFNMALEKLPPKIKGVLERSALKDKLNLQGEVCRTFMITGAGAEGLSLRNVRQVHIMEPHWNKVRTEQVKGRAVRICSHSSFERLEDRTVEVYTYLAVLDPVKVKAHQIDETLLIMDEAKTTDEYLFDISETKEQLGQSFLDAMKKGAVDCQLNYWENDEVPCQVGFDGSVNDFLFDPRIEEDIKMTRGQMRVAPTIATRAAATAAPAPKKGAVYEFGGKTYFTRDIEGRRYLYRSQAEAETNKERLAEVVRNEATGKNKIKRV